jgi:hypothetical protein
MVARSESRSNDALPVCLHNENSHRLVSLWDMVLAKGAQVLAIWPNIKNLSLGFGMGGEDSITPEEARDCLSSTIDLCRQIGWADLSNQGSRLLRRAVSGEAGEPMKLLTEDFIEALKHKTEELQVLVIEERDNGLFKDATKDGSERESVELPNWRALGMAAPSVTDASRRDPAPTSIMESETWRRMEVLLRGAGIPSQRGARPVGSGNRNLLFL